MSDILSFLQNLIISDKLSIIREQFLDGKLQDELLNKKYYRLGRENGFSASSEADAVSFYQFEYDSVSRLEDPYQIKYSFEEYLTDLLHSNLQKLNRPWTQLHAILSDSRRKELIIYKRSLSTLRKIVKSHVVYKNYSVLIQTLDTLLSEIIVFEQVISPDVEKLTFRGNKKNLPDFKRCLITNKFISNQVTLKIFNSVFIKDRKIINKIWWIGKKNSFHYFIKLLEEEDKIEFASRKKYLSLNSSFVLTEEPEYDFSNLPHDVKDISERKFEALRRCIRNI